MIVHVHQKGISFFTLLHGPVEPCNLCTLEASSAMLLSKLILYLILIGIINCVKIKKARKFSEIHIYEGESTTLFCGTQTHLADYTDWGYGPKKCEIKYSGSKKSDEGYDVKKVSKKGDRWFACKLKGGKRPGRTHFFWLNVTG